MNDEGSKLKNNVMWVWKKGLTVQCFDWWGWRKGWVRTTRVDVYGGGVTDDVVLPSGVVIPMTRQVSMIRMPDAGEFAHHGVAGIEAVQFEFDNIGG